MDAMLMTGTTLRLILIGALCGTAAALPALLILAFTLGTIGHASDLLPLLTLALIVGVPLGAVMGPALHAAHRGTSIRRLGGSAMAGAIIGALITAFIGRITGHREFALLLAVPAAILGAVLLAGWSARAAAQQS